MKIQQELDKILDKVAKLKELRNRAGTEHEAESAAVKLHALMTKYNLTEAQVDNATVSGRAGSSIDHIMFTMTSEDEWKRILLAGIAQYTFCRAVFHRGRTSASLFGSKVNTDNVIWMYDYIHNDVIRRGAVGWRELPVEVADEYRDSGVGRDGWTMAYRTGAVDAVLTRLREQFERDTIHANAIVLHSEELLEQAIQDAFGDQPEEMTRQQMLNEVAYRSGAIAGLRINFDKQVGATAEQEVAAIGG